MLSSLNYFIYITHVQVKTKTVNISLNNVYTIINKHVLHPNTSPNLILQTWQIFGSVNKIRPASKSSRASNLEQ